MALGLLAAFAGCKREAPAPAAQSSGSGSKAVSHDGPWLIGVSLRGLGDSRGRQTKADIAAAAARHPAVRVVFKDAGGHVPRQCAQVAEFLADRVDAIIISPCNAVTLTPPAKRAHEAGIAVIVLDRPLVGDAYSCFVGPDHAKIGRAAGEHVAKLLGGAGNVMELRGPIASRVTAALHSGFLRGIAAHAGIKIVAEVECRDAEADARAAMESELSRCLDIDLVCAHRDAWERAAWLAAKAEGKGREKMIKFVGVGGLPGEGAAYVKQGVLAAAFQHPTGGREALDAALAVLEGRPVPNTLMLTTRLLTRHNVEQGGEVIQ